MKKLLLPLMLYLITTNLSFAAKEYIYTKNAPEPIGTYSQAVKVGNTVYISGQIPIDPSTGKMVEGGFKNQVKQALSNVSEITKAAGGNVNDIVKLTVYLTDVSNFSDLNEAMEKVFQKPYPARSVVEIKALPRTDAMVEIEAVMSIE